MILHILNFGVARDLVGADVWALEVPDAVTVGGLKEHILAAHPRFQSLKSLMIAVNAEYGAEDAVLKETDEIALIPPVSGG
jgi:molybdopterin converting factor subunit 1